MESNLISERAQTGLAAMKTKNGGNSEGHGRPLKLSVAQWSQLVRMRSEGNPQTSRV